MALIPEVPAGQSWKVSSETLNALIRAANTLNRLRVVDYTDPDGATRSTFRVNGNGAILRIVHPPSPAATGLPDGVAFEEFTICDSGTPATRWLATWTSDPS